MDDTFRAAAQLRPLLTRHERQWRLREDDQWCRADPLDQAEQVQGWKLHVSATAASAPAILVRTAEILIRRGCRFKVAATLRRVSELCSRSVDRGAGGKFLTAYPEGTDDELRELAAELDDATAGQAGPVILSDRPYRTGSLVHYRYGAFRGVRVLGNDGSYEALLRAPDGRLVRDERNAWFSVPSWAPPDPFRAATPAAATAPGPVLLGDRYAVHEVIRHSFTGGVFRATDQRSGVPVIIKQARAHTGGDTTGRDARDLRRHEAAMLERFAGSGRTPRPLAVFEQENDLFLVQESLPGRTLRSWVTQRDAAVTTIAPQLADLVDLVHRQGLVLRDFNPNNVLVDDGGVARLIDLELLCEPGSAVPPAHTPGYTAAEAFEGPTQSADLFSLGATLFHLFTGADPLLAPDRPGERAHQDRIRAWFTLLPLTGRRAELIVALLDADPARRPALDAARAVLSAPEPVAPQRAGTPIAVATPPGHDRMVRDAVVHLRVTMDPDADERLWPSSGFAATTDPLNVQHGAAGVLGVLVQVHRAEPAAISRAALVTAARWIARRADREPRLLPGLHFGRSGTAWSLLEAGRLLGDPKLIGTATGLARRIPLEWPNPDVCHGLAGAGLAQLHFFDVTGDPDFLGRARDTARTLAAAALRRDPHVLWPIPRDFPSAMAGVVHYGFAHGVAGIGTFLLAAARATGDSELLDLAISAGETMLATAQTDVGCARWPTGPRGGAPRTNWCSGSSGAGTFLIRLWRHTGDDRYAELAVRAAAAVRDSRWRISTAQCHGLAGDGEFLLDLAEALGERQYHDWAEELATAVMVRAVLREGRLLAPDESGVEVLADYGTGLAGVLSFLLRLRAGGQRLWLPAASRTRAATYREAGCPTTPLTTQSARTRPMP